MAKENKAIEEKALALSEKTAEDTGVYVVDVSYSKNDDGGYSLCYYIDKPEGLGIDECETFSRAVEEALDKADIIDENYVLEVSSPGVDRTLKKEREFLYYIGREVDVKLYSAIEGVKEFTGVLRGFENNEAAIEYKDKILNIPVKKAVYIKLSFRF